MRRKLGIAFIAVIALVTAACSSDDSSSTGSGDGPSDAGKAAYEANKADVEAAYEGTFSLPPSDSPEPQEGKRVTIISCGESISSCSVPTAAMKEAGEALGWKVNVFDGKADPTNYANGIREAMGAGVDGIIGVATGCDRIPEPLRDAKEAGIAVMGFSAFDCDDPFVEAGDPVFSSRVLFQGFESMGDYRMEWGRRKAEWVIDATGGEAKVLLVTIPGSALHESAVEGFEEKLAECETCSIEATIDITSADAAKPVGAQKLEAALLKHNGANALVLPNDAAFAQYATSALNSVPMDLKVMGGECFEENLDLIRDGGPQHACVALPQEWQAWAVVDQLNRFFADPDADPVDQGLGFQLVDEDHNLSDSGPWTPGDVDYKAEYKKAWGVS